MRLRDLGERRLIDRLARLYGTVNRDDCATLDAGGDYLLVTSDLVSQHTHFPADATAYQMGWFVVAVNLSDIAAAGGAPEGVVLSLGLPPDLEVDFLEELAAGARACATSYATAVIGGDTKEAPSLILCGTALGRVAKRRYLSRRGMAPGDRVCVTGGLGRAGAALEALEALTGGGDGQTLEALLLVQPRLAAGQAAAAVGGVTAAMDLSDGLSSSLYQLMALNQAGFRIEAEAVPVDPLAEESGDPLRLALHAGGDYEMLFTVRPEAVEGVRRAVEATGLPCTVIGRVIHEQRAVVVREDGEQVLPDGGYEHFRARGKTL
ncbi:MAG: thiamine-phosphate kinase [Thermoplasmatota archaeon]